MANINLITGGTGHPLFPNCNSRLSYGAPYADSIAEEYARGYYTLSKPINPCLMEHQRVEMDEANMAVNDIIFATVVPSKHLLTSVYFETTASDETMVGATLAPVLLSVDNTGTFTPLTVLDEMAPVTLDKLGISFLHIEKPTLVPANTVYVIGLKVTALPTDTTMKLADMLAQVSIVAKIQDFASHQQE